MLVALNLDEATLDDRFLGPYRRGSSLTVGGRSIASTAIDQVLVWETPDPVESLEAAVSYGQDRTDDFVTGPPGGQIAASGDFAAPGVATDPARVMIVHGRNVAALDALRAFLNSLGLVPVLWEDAIAATGVGSPHNLDAVMAALATAQAVVVLFTAEDEARLLPTFRLEPDDGILVGQPRPNVLIEAGMTLALGRERTILARLGRIRVASDLDGLNAVNLDDSVGSRTALWRRLKTAGCDINETTDYLNSGVAGRFAGAHASGEVPGL